MNNFLSASMMVLSFVGNAANARNNLSTPDSNKGLKDYYKNYFTIVSINISASLDQLIILPMLNILRVARIVIRGRKWCFRMQEDFLLPRR
jgi:hypothetical protein